MRKKDIKTLNDVREYLDSIPNISQGGCGVSALAMYQWLKANNKLYSTTKIVYLYATHMKSAYSNNKKALACRNVQPTSCNHAVLLHKRKYIDSSNSFSSLKELHNSNRTKLALSMSAISVVQKSISNSRVWNDSFDRNKYIPEIEKKLNIKLGV